MRGEEWHSCISALGYIISNRGDIREVHNGRDEYIEPYLGEDGEAWVDLVVETQLYDYARSTWSTRMESFRVWRLMIESWFSNWQRGYFIKHLDGDPFNNDVANLAATIIDGRGNERLIGVRDDGYFYAFDRRKRGKVEVVETGDIFDGVKAAAIATGALVSNVSHVLAGRLETTKGYHYKWISD